MARTGRRHGLLVPLLLVVGGILLLLANLGVIEIPTWQTIVRYWPVLLIAVGIDLVFGRSSISGAVSGLVAIGLVVVLGTLAFRFLAPPAWQLRDETVLTSIDGAESARIVLSCDDCTLVVDSRHEPDSLVEGVVSVSRLSTLTQSIERQDSALLYELASASQRWIPWSLDRSQSPEWRLSLNRTIPVELTVSAARDVDLDLSGVRLTSADVTSTAGHVRLVLSEQSTGRYVISGGAITLVAPPGLGVSVEHGSLINVDLPEGYIQSGSTVLSQGLGTDDIHAAILIRSASRLTVLSAPDEPSEATDGT